MVTPSLLPILLVDGSRGGLAYLHDSLREAGVENPLVTFPSQETVLDYLEAVCLAALPQFVPCLMLLDAKLPSIAAFLTWVRTQEILARLKIVILGERSGEPLTLGDADHCVPRFPNVLTLAKLVACACARGAA